MKTAETIETMVFMLSDFSRWDNKKLFMLMIDFREMKMEDQYFENF